MLMGVNAYDISITAREMAMVVANGMNDSQEPPLVKKYCKTNPFQNNLTIPIKRFTVLFPIIQSSIQLQNRKTPNIVHHSEEEARSPTTCTVSTYSPTIKKDLLNLELISNTAKRPKVTQPIVEVESRSCPTATDITPNPNPINTKDILAPKAKLRCSLLPRAMFQDTLSPVEAKSEGKHHHPKPHMLTSRLSNKFCTNQNHNTVPIDADSSTPGIH